MDSLQQAVRRLVGDITPTQYRHVDVALARHLGVFTPISGPCEYATSPAHTHPAYSFVLSFDGTTRMLLDGRILSARPGEISAVGPRIPHQELPGDGPPRYAAIMIAPHFLLAQLRAYPGLGLPDLRGQTWPASPELCRSAKDFMIECEARLPGREVLLEAHALKLTHQILRLIMGVTAASGRVAVRMDINRAVEFLHSHLCEPLPVTDLAHAAGLSVSHFSREFRREMGMGPKQYLLQARLSHARRLLLAGPTQVTEIAHASGFASLAHFSGAFHAAYGISPSRFRHATAKRQKS
jgi:AraC family transcriptional regulator